MGYPKITSNIENEIIKLYESGNSSLIIGKILNLSSRTVLNYLNKKKNETAKQIWDYDTNKLDLAKNNGYNIEVIWESDYTNNIKKIINELIVKYGKY